MNETTMIEVNAVEEEYLLLSITTPADGATVPAQSLPASITVAGEVEFLHVTVDRVEVQLGAGGAVQRADVSDSGPQVKSWSLTGQVAASGPLWIWARAVGTFTGDKSQRTSEQTITVTIADVVPPDLTITAPRPGDTFPGDGRVSQVPVSVEAADSLSGIRTIDWILDGVLQVRESFASPLPTSWSGTREVSIPASAVESHDITVRCTDGSGNPTERSVTITTPDTTAPFYEIIEPKEGAQVPDSNAGAVVTLRGTAEDRQSGVQAVEWALDDGDYTPAESSDGWKNWQKQVTIPKGGIGVHAIAVRFRDNEGNQDVKQIHVKVVQPYKPEDANDLVGARAYLQDLLWFAETHVSTPATSLTAPYLEQVFHQPFTELLADPRAQWGDQQVNQVRVCIEVLRKHLVGVAHWRFDEGSGTEVADSSGSDNDGTLQGATWSAGQVGAGALRFDGIDDSVTVAAQPTLRNVTNNFTVAFWAKPLSPHEIDPENTSGITGTAGQRYVMGPQHGQIAYGSLDHAGVGISVGTNGVSVYEHTGDYLPALLVYQAAISGWTHIAVVYRDKQPRLYVNGILVKTGLTSLKQCVHTCPQALGRHVDEKGMSYGAFDGDLDDVRIYDRPLSAVEIRALAAEAAEDVEAALREAESRYRQAAYEALLTRLGTSYEEIRLVRGADQETRSALAARLGIDLDPVAPDQLEQLRLQPGQITEAKLEELFGLASTTRDPWQSMGEPQLLQWQLEHLHTVWKQQDHLEQPTAEPRQPIIDSDLIGEDDLVSAVAGNAAFDIWQDRTTQVSGWLGELRDHREAEAEALDGFNRIVAETLGPVGQWKCDEGSGTVASDSSGNLLTGTLQGATWSAGKVGPGALMFDGIDDYVKVDPAVKLVLTNAGSIAAWIKPLGPGSASTGGIIVNKESEYAVARFPDGTIQWAFANSNPGWTWINTDFVAPENQWTHIAVVYDDGRVDTYANGQLVHTYAGAGAIGDVNTTLNDFRIAGRQGVAQHFQGCVDEVMVYNRAFSAGEVATLFTFAGTDLSTLAEAYQQGRDIGPALKALHLSPQAFWRLLRIRDLAATGTVTEAEWQDVYNILVQVQKSQQYGKWHEVERQQQVALLPRYFKLSASAKALPAWRATPVARRDWQDILRARMDQEQSVMQALQTTVQAVEEAALPALRDALVTAIDANESLSDAADWLTEQLLVDAKGGGSQQTTRILQAIETLQGIFFSVRTGRFPEDHPASSWELSPSEAQFDEAWRWMGTHATWRAAMLVFFYPENFLLPSLRPEGERTSQFATLVTDSRKPRLTPQETRNLAGAYLEELRKALGDKLEPQLRDPSFVLTEQLSEQDLVERHDLATELLEPYVDKMRKPPRLKPETPAHLKEVFYFVPIQLALQLQKSGEYVVALDWFQTVYAYNLPMDKRKIYYGLELEQNLPPILFRSDDWLQELNPHTLAAGRPNPYTRYTLFSLARCFLEFADAEFTRDTGQAIANARALYMSARSLLSLDELKLPVPATPDDIMLPNPVQEALGLRADMHLAKLRQGRNIAGMKRQVEPLTPPKAVSGLPTVDSRGQLIAPGPAVLQPTPYRYSVLIERGKQLVSLAQQLEAAYLAALEKRDAETYNLKKAGYDLELAEAHVELQNLRVTEANDGKGLADKQKRRAAIQQQTYQEWINAGLNEQENIMLRQYEISRTNRDWMAGLEAAQATAQAAASATSLDTLVSPAGGFYALAAAAALAKVIPSMEINAAEQRLQEASLRASHERRKQEWMLQKSLADQDWSIADQQWKLADHHAEIVSQEQAIASTQSTQAKAMAQFLATKFTNAELYAWMGEVLGGVYGYFLQQATAMAQLAQNQLAFERQETPPNFILADYWEPPAETGAGGGTDGKAPDRRGLTGSARLLQDIYQLDQYAFETNKRKLNLSQTFSLARLAPFEFQQFRQTGVLHFATPMRLFDQGFPGHYLRLIKRVRTSVVALIPPTHGIRAALTASGISRVLINTGGVLQEAVVRRDPETVALASPTNATGVFELDVQPEMLLPFEAMGVATSWELWMPKAANPFDFNTMADVLITMEYTALNSFDYRQQIIQQLDRNVSAERPVSFRQQCADAWYDLHNPDQTATPMTVRFKTMREDFPPNIEALKLQHMVLYFARANGKAFEVPVTHLHFTEQGGTGTVGGGATSIDGVISTRRGNAGSWTAMIGKSACGEWELALPNTEEMKNHFKNEEIEDILFVITYSGRTPEWPT